jgi:hypothetical protein
VEQISPGRVRLLRHAAQRLHRTKRDATADVVARLVGVPAQDRSAALLALRARTRGLAARDVEAALREERSIVWTWAMRGTLHVILAEDHGWVVPLVKTAALPGTHRRLREVGVTGDEAARAIRLIARMLETDAPMTRAEIADGLARRGIRAEGQGIVHLIRLAALQEVACYGPVQRGKPTLVLVRDWLGRGRTMDHETALSLLASRYIAAHGPAAPEDFATWSGLHATDAKRAWRTIADRLVEVKTGQRSLWMERSRRTDPPSGIVRLIPRFDPYFLGWKGREFSVPKEHERKVFPGGSVLHPAVLVDGLASGTWTQKRHGDRLEVTVSPFARLTRPARGQLLDETEDVGRFLGLPVDVAIQ